MRLSQFGQLSWPPSNRSLSLETRCGNWVKQPGLTSQGWSRVMWHCTSKHSCSHCAQTRQWNDYLDYLKSKGWELQNYRVWVTRVNAAQLLPSQTETKLTSRLNIYHHHTSIVIFVISKYRWVGVNLHLHCISKFMNERTKNCVSYGW